MTSPHEIHALPPDAQLSVWQPPRLRAVAKYRPGAGLPESIEIEFNEPVTQDVVRGVVASLLIPPGQTRPAGEVVITGPGAVTHTAPTYDPGAVLRDQQYRMGQSYGGRA